MSNNARRQQQSAHELNNRGTRDREYVEQQQNQRLRDGGGEMENPARRIDATAPIPIDSVAEDAQLAAAIAASMAATDDEPRATTDGAAAPSASGSRSNSSSRPVDVDGSSVRTRDAGSSHEDIDMADVHPTWNNAIRSTSNNSDGGITSALPPLASGPSSSTTPPSTDYNNASDGNENASLQRAASRLLSATDPTLNRQRSLRAEQDDAFQESLALDRAKAASERSEHERQQREREQAERVEQERLQAREAKRRRVCDPPPKSTPAEQVTELAIRLPNGQRLQRRFFSTDRFENVYDYVEIEAPQLDGVAFDLTTFDRKKLYGDRMVQLAELPTRKAALVVHLRD